MGPSPIVPSLMVGALGLVIFGPSLACNSWMLLPLLLLLLINVISSWFPSSGDQYFGAKQGSSSGSINDDEYGFGSFLLLVLFFILYNVWQ